MQLIAHRRNTVAQLATTPNDVGVEIDIRSWGDELVLHHDPFVRGESFERWLDGYTHGTLILNVKEEGIEDRLLAAMQARGLQDFFLLDQSFPFLLKSASRGERRSAVRVSEFEPPTTALALGGQLDWVWVDCFSRFPLNYEGWTALARAGYRLCVVSPDLVGRADESEILALRRTFAEWGVVPDAVCTKLGSMPTWRQAL